VHLTPREVDKLLIATAADLARKRRARGLKLNYPEALALITAELLEAIRDGKSVSELMEYGADDPRTARRHGRGSGDAGGSAGGRDLSGWDEARDGPSPHPLGCLRQFT